MNKINLNAIYQWPIKKQMPVFGVVFIIVFLGGYSWDISHFKTKLAAAQDQEADLKQQMTLMITNQAENRGKLIQYPLYQDLLAKWRAKLITHDKLPELLKEILKIGAQNNLHFSLFNPEDEEKDGIYTKVPISMIIVGGYHQTADFVSQIANMANIVVIKNFSITNENKPDELGTKLAEKANNEKLLTSKMQFEIYFMPEKSV